MIVETYPSEEFGIATGIDFIYVDWGLINQLMEKLIKVLNKPVKDLWNIAGIKNGNLNIT